MLNIVLLCNWGASTGMLAEKIKEAADAAGVEAEVNAYNVNEAANVSKGADIILLGPQVRFKAKQIIKDNDLTIPVVAMDPQDYGLLKGDVIFDKVMELLKEEKE